MSQKEIEAKANDLMTPREAAEKHAKTAKTKAMTAYRITSREGVDLGIYEAEDEAGALDALARDAGYESQAECTARGIPPFEGQVDRV